MFFYRDRHGTEVDLVIERGNRFTIIEAKAGQTPSSDMFGAARRIGAVLSATGPSELIVAYGGQSRQMRRDGILLPWNEIHEQSWTD